VLLIPAVPAGMLPEEHRSKVAGVVVRVVAIDVVDQEATGQELMVSKFPGDVRPWNLATHISVGMLGAKHLRGDAAFPARVFIAETPEHRVLITTPTEHRVLGAAHPRLRLAPTSSTAMSAYLWSTDATVRVSFPTRFDRVSHIGIIPK